MYRIMAPSKARLAGLLERGALGDLTYPEIGGTIYGEKPRGYHHQTIRALVPGGTFEAGKKAITTWRGHHHAGAEMVPSVPSVKLGTSMAFGIRSLGLWFTAVCRIVGVVDEDGLYGIAYGTLPHHPERGEEIFLVRRMNGGIEFEIRSFSRPNSPIVRALGPFGRALQRRLVRRYLNGLVRAVRSDPDRD